MIRTIKLTGKININFSPNYIKINLKMTGLLSEYDVDFEPDDLNEIIKTFDAKYN